MALLEVSLAVLQLLVIQVRDDVGHLDVSVLGVQVLWVHLCIHKTNISLRLSRGKTLKLNVDILDLCAHSFFVKS